MPVYRVLQAYNLGSFSQALIKNFIGIWNAICYLGFDAIICMDVLEESSFVLYPLGWWNLLFCDLLQ